MTKDRGYRRGADPVSVPRDPRMRDLLGPDDIGGARQARGGGRSDGVGIEREDDVGRKGDGSIVGFEIGLGERRRSRVKRERQKGERQPEREDENDAGRPN